MNGWAVAGMTVLLAAASAWSVEDHPGAAAAAVVPDGPRGGAAGAPQEAGCVLFLSTRFEGDLDRFWIISLDLSEAAQERLYGRLEVAGYQPGEDRPVADLRFLGIGLETGQTVHLWTELGAAAATVAKITLRRDPHLLYRSGIELGLDPDRALGVGAILLSSEPLEGETGWRAREVGDTTLITARDGVEYALTHRGEGYGCDYSLSDERNRVLWRGPGWCPEVHPFVDLDGDGFPELLFPSSHGAAALRQIYPREATIVTHDSGV